jgi:hypothetical protein
LNVNTEELEIPVDDASMPALPEPPAGDAPRPAIIVLQEIFGVNTEFRRTDEPHARSFRNGRLAKRPGVREPRRDRRLGSAQAFFRRTLG